MSILNFKTYFMEKAIGLIIKQIIDEKNIKVATVASKLGVTRQAIYQAYAKLEMSEGELVRWSNALEVDKNYIVNKQKGELTTDKSSFGSEVLGTLKRMIEVEMQEKNERIRNLEDMLRQSMAMNKELLGKSEGVASVGLESPFFYGLLTNSLTPNGPLAVTA